jgi:Uma2 family endonuclease
MSPQEYLAWEREQANKHELHDGEIFAMAGGSPRHNALALAVGAELRAALRGRDCRALNSDQRIGLLFRKKYVYPDASVVCGEVVTEEGARDVVVNPSVVVEVLSASTEGYDRGGKWDGYRRLASVDDYLLVSQRAPTIEHFQRMADGSWRYTVASEGEQIELTTGARLSVDAVYEGVFELPGDEDGELELTAEP